MSHAKDYDAVKRFAIPEELEAELRKLPADESGESRSLVGCARTLQARVPNRDMRSLLAVRTKGR